VRRTHIARRSAAAAAARRRRRRRRRDELELADPTSPTRTSEPRHTHTRAHSNKITHTHTHTHTHPFNGPLSGTTQVSRYQKGKTNLDFTEARDSQWQWHQLGHMQVCTSLQTDNHTSTPPVSFYRPSCRPTNSVNALKSNLFAQNTSHFNAASGKSS